MKDRFDLNEFVNVDTIQSVNCRLVERVKERRKELKLTREELSKRSGVSYASLRRFEETGNISTTHEGSLTTVTIDGLQSFLKEHIIVK